MVLGLNPQFAEFRSSRYINPIPWGIVGLASDWGELVPVACRPGSVVAAVACARGLQEDFGPSVNAEVFELRHKLERSRGHLNGLSQLVNLRDG